MDQGPGGATRSTRAKPAPEEELIGTITATGLRLTKEASRAQQVYRATRGGEVGPRPRVRRWVPGRAPSRPRGAIEGSPATHLKLEWRLSWCSSAPLRVQVALDRSRVAAEAPRPVPTAPDSTRPQRRRPPVESKKGRARTVGGGTRKGLSTASGRPDGMGIATEAIGSSPQGRARAVVNKRRPQVRPAAKEG